jgi:hypothetical protein
VGTYAWKSIGDDLVVVADRLGRVPADKVDIGSA